MDGHGSVFVFVYIIEFYLQYSLSKEKESCNTFMDAAVSKYHAVVILFSKCSTT